MESVQVSPLASRRGRVSSLTMMAEAFKMPCMFDSYSDGVSRIISVLMAQSEKPLKNPV